MYLHGIEKKGKKLLAVISCFLLLATGQIFIQPLQITAAVSDLSKVEQTMEQAIKDGDKTIVFTASAGYTTAQLKKALENAAKSQDRLLSGTIRFTKRINNMDGSAEYTIILSEDALMKVKRLNSKKAAQILYKTLKER